MKIEAYLSIGFATANHEEIIEIPDEDLEGLTKEEKDDYINECVQEWADNYIEIDWREV